ncbi:Hypothetical protein PBC10988_22400 [Planctomycetales bacterium 10988]|nr:Hypothetical protein PBC10988_22400 [Planctomycetales bacterium 10988]
MSSTNLESKTAAIPLENFLQVLRETNLLDDTLMHQVESEVRRGGRPMKTDQAIQWLTERGYLTNWQAKQILAGNLVFEIGQYTLLEQIGQGGMGLVFRAEHQVMGREVAVKVLSRARLNNEAAVARFRREVKTLGKLHHPNIVTAHDAGQIEEVQYLVMEYVKGRDLGALVKYHKQLPIDWSAECIRQTALGLAHAHRQGLVHRDIKPANLLVTKDEASDLPLVKILDLGLARLSKGEVWEATPKATSMVQASQDNDGQVTEFGHIVGTPDYLSPEQVRGKDVDIRSDIFSLGCTFFQMLTGRIPFGGKNVVEKIALRGDMDGPPAPSVRTLREEVPEELAQIIAQMLERDPDKRMQTPGEVGLALMPFSLISQSSASASSSGLIAPEASGIQGSSSSSILMIDTLEEADTDFTAPDEVKLSLPHRQGQPEAKSSSIEKIVQTTTPQDASGEEGTQDFMNMIAKADARLDQLEPEAPVSGPIMPPSASKKSSRSSKRRRNSPQADHLKKTKTQSSSLSSPSRSSLNQSTEVTEEMQLSDRSTTSNLSPQTNHRGTILLLAIVFLGILLFIGALGLTQLFLD